MTWSQGPSGHHGNNTNGAGGQGRRADFVNPNGAGPRRSEFVNPIMRQAEMLTQKTMMLQSPEDPEVSQIFSIKLHQ